MKIEALADADAVARAGAVFIAAEARASVAARGRFIMAISRDQSVVLVDHEAAARWRFQPSRQ